MDYEKAYNAVLKTAKQWIKDGCTGKERICLECVFPELRESEDERMLSELILHFEGIKEQALFDNQEETDNVVKSCNEKIAWLEKQKEQNWIPTDEQRFALGMVIKYSDPDADNTKVLESLLDELTKIANPKVAKWKEKQKEQQKEQIKVAWKPNAEQMEALMLAIEGKGPAPTSYLSRRLEDLYEGLANTYGIECTLMED